MPLLRNARGGALLTALFIMTLVAIVATAMSTRLQLDIYRTRLIVVHDKMYLASQTVMFWAMNQLNDPKIHYIKLNKQHMVDQYPKNLEALDKQIKVSGGLYDLQARFNLNNLQDKKMLPVFTNLLSHTAPELNNAERRSLTLAVEDWMLDYDLSRGKDNYISYYLSQKPPYYPSRQPMASLSELRLVKDVNSSLYQNLDPFVTALSEAEPTPININTASKQVLMSLGNGLNELQVNELISARGDDGIKDLKDIAELIKKLDLPAAQITIESQYFLAVAYTSSDEFKLTIYTLLRRHKDKDGKLAVSVIRESINGF